MRAQKCIVLPGERVAAFEAFEAALMEELAPEGALQTVLAQRVVAASWRLARAERLEAELFAQNMLAGRGLGLALIRDCNGARAFDTLLRYRGGTLAELWRALRTLKGLQAEATAGRGARTGARTASAPRAARKCRSNPSTAEILGDSGPPSDRVDAEKADPGPASARLPHRPLPTAGEAASCVQPIEPERREQPAKAALRSLASEMVEPAGAPPSLLAGTALVPPRPPAGASGQPGLRRRGARPARRGAPG